MFWPWWPRRRRFRAGEWGEREAEKFLRAKGFVILGRRVRPGRRDELDLVARDGSTLVFVEVKTRRSEAFGRAASAIDRRKRMSQSRAAVHYLRKLRVKPEYFRFDVVEVVGSEEVGREELRHIENAFQLGGAFRPTW